MKKRLRGIQLFVVLTIALLLPAQSTYLQYDSLTEVNFLFGKATWEDFDQEGLLADRQEKAKAFPSSIFYATGFLVAHPLDELSFLPFPLSSSDQKTFILRC